MRFVYPALPSCIYLILYSMNILKSLYGFFILSIISATLLFLYTANFVYSKNLSPFFVLAYDHKLLPHPSHQTVWMRNSGIRNPLAPGDFFINFPEYKVANGEVRSVNVEYFDDKIALTADVISDKAIIMLKRYYYPGWIISINPPNQTAEIIEKKGLLSVVLPSGQNHIDLVHTYYPGGKAANLISLFGLMLLLSNYFFEKRIFIGKALTKYLN